MNRAPSLWDHRKPPLAQEHSDTSRAAAAAIEPRAKTLRQRVYAVIAARPRTDEEGIDALGMSPSTYRPRRVELVEMGRVRDSGLRRRTKAGRLAVVWST